MRCRIAHPSFVFLTGIGTAAIVVACNRDAPDPLAPRPLDGPRPASATVPASQADAATIGKRRQPGVKFVPMHALHTDGVPQGGDVWAVDMDINGSEKVLEFRLDASGQYIDKMSFYSAGERYYGANLQWANDASGQYVSSMTQTAYVSSDQAGPGNSVSYDPNTGWTENGRWEPMQLPLGSDLYMTVKGAVRAHFVRGLSRSVAMQGSTNCTSSNVNALVNFAVQVWDAVKSDDHTPPPPPSANLAGGLQCMIDGLRGGIEYVNENFAQPIRNMEIGVAVYAVVRAEQMWDTLRRPFTVNGTQPSSGSEVWLRTSGDCSATLGRACTSLSAYMQQ